jgi:hypothetical protein
LAEGACGEAMAMSAANQGLRLRDQIAAGSEELELQFENSTLIQPPSHPMFFLRNFSKTRDKATGNIYNFRFRSQLENLVGGFLTRNRIGNIGNKD